MAESITEGTLKQFSKRMILIVGLLPVLSQLTFLQKLEISSNGTKRSQQLRLIRWVKGMHRLVLLWICGN